MANKENVDPTPKIITVVNVQIIIKEIDVLVTKVINVRTNPKKKTNRNVVRHVQTT